MIFNLLQTILMMFVVKLIIHFPRENSRKRIAIVAIVILIQTLLAKVFHLILQLVPFLKTIQGLQNIKKIASG